MLNRAFVILAGLVSVIVLPVGTGSAFARCQTEVKVPAGDGDGVGLDFVGHSGTVSGPTALTETDRDEDEGMNSGSASVFKRSPLTGRVLVVGNYPSYATDELTIGSIRYDMLSHIMYFSLSPLANGDLDVADVNVEDLQELVTHAEANGVKTFISVGGWGRSRHFSAMAANPGTRTNFAANLAQYCLDHHLDGADLDWEPIWSGTDKTNYSLLVEKLHDEFEPLGLTLTVSVSAYGDEITRRAIGFVDWLNVMAYDDTPLHHSTFDFALSSLAHWENYGAPREKLMLGVPFYGKKANGTGYAYKYIIDTYHPGPEVDFVGGIGFNGIDTIKRKAEYVINNGFRGIMIWEISQDTTDDSSLLTAIKDTIIAASPADFNGDDHVAVVGNYPSYATDELTIGSIRYDMLSHIMYFSLSPLANGDLDVADVNVEDLQELVTHAEANGVKTFISVGGWGRSRHFSAMAANPGTRTNFAANLAQYCLDHHLDGADLDWEPIWSGTDKTNYSLLVEKLHDEFEPLGLTLTVSVSAYGDEITRRAIGFVDWLNVMAYDDTPLHHSTFDFALSSLAHWENYGAPREKLMLGVPFYGKKANGTGYAYKYIIDTYHPGPEVDFVGGIGFNGIDTIKRKAEYVINNGFRGIMIWEISQDTTDDSSLLTAIKDTIIAASPADFNGDDRSR